MNPKNIRTMTVAAVVIVMCLLFSWVQYGDVREDDGYSGEAFEGTWHSVYSNVFGNEYGGSVGEFTATVSGDSVRLSGEYVSGTYILLSDREAVSVDAGAGTQIYLEGGFLYLVSVFYMEGTTGIVYIAASQDASAVLPDDASDLGRTSTDMTTRRSNGVEFRDSIPATFTVDSHSNHIAMGTIEFDVASYGFSGFVKSDGSRSVILGSYWGDRGHGDFYAVLDDGEAAFSMDGGISRSGHSSGFHTDLPDGTLTVGTSSGDTMFDVYVDEGLANIVGGSEYYPATVMWTLGDDRLVFGNDSVAAFDGSRYVMTVDRLTD